MTHPANGAGSPLHLNRPRGRDAWRFARQFFRSPMTTASLVPSSSYLAERMVAPIPRTGDPAVVELGAGTGAFTAAAQRVLGGRGTHVAIECNREWARLLASRYPGVDVVCADAHDLLDVLAARGMRADVVISGLPWAAYWPKDKQPLVELVADSLVERGSFTQFSYAWSRWAPPARRQHRELRENFEETVVSRTVMRNFPPAYVYFARRPRA
ncbi:class I SAM-dependent methyltransferase [Sciscionella marina]|uniref:class I SAM-dependent methyltransferase n=1 Tax=Sciscionella marina TaxID=508770 RepID=UPI0003737F85|nr:methyltransferase domain-containing protein [Sciscionella marina]